MFERKRFSFCLEIQRKLTGLSNKFEPFTVFGQSEFEGPRFDCISWRSVLLVGKLEDPEKTANKNRHIHCIWLGLWFLMTLLFSYIVAVSFIGGNYRSTRRKPPICRKSLTNFVTFVIYNLTVFLVGTLRHQTLSQGPQAYCRSSAGIIPWCAKSLHALRFLTSRNYHENSILT